MSELAGQAAIVSGGTQGIGLAAATALARAGAAVTAWGLPDAQLDAAERTCAAGGLDVRCVACDVRRSEAVTHAVEEALAAHGRLDIVVNSAGIQRYGTVVETTDDVWDDVLSTNAGSVFRVCRAAIPEMRSGGAVVNVSSVQALAAEAGAAAYAASKGAVNALTRALAVDHAREGIRINAVCPGSVDTPMLRWAAARQSGAGGAEANVAAWGDRHLLGRVARPEEIADVVCFLAGPRAGFVTGAELVVDGGLLAALSTVREAADA